MPTAIKGLMSCLGLAFLIGCAQPAYQDYQLLEAQQHSVIYKNQTEAINSTQPRAMVRDDFTVAQIRITDPVFRLGDTLTNFQVFDSGPLTSGAYVLNVASTCIHCKGYRIKQVLPYFVLRNSQNEEVPTFKQSSSGLSDLHFTLHFNILEEDRLKILIAADNRHTDKVDAVFLPRQRNSINLPLSFEYGPEGNVSFSLNKVE